MAKTKKAIILQTDKPASIEILNDPNINLIAGKPKVGVKNITEIISTLTIVLDLGKELMTMKSFFSIFNVAKVMRLFNAFGEIKEKIVNIKPLLAGSWTEIKDLDTDETKAIILLIFKIIEKYTHKVVK